MERILTGISEEKFKELSTLLEQKTGVALSGHEEVVELHGFAVSYLYNLSLQTMTLKLERVS